MKRVVPWLLTFIVCTPNVLSGVETVNALTRDKKEQTKISDVKFSKDAIHSKEKMDLTFKIEKPKESPLERTYSIPKDIEHSLIPTKSKYVIKQKKKEVGEIRFKKDKMMVQWKQDTAQQKIETDCTLEVKAHYYNDEEEMNKVKIGKEVTKILPAIEPLENENLLIQDIHYQPLERKKENQVVLDLKWPVTTELKEGNQYVFKLPKWMEAKKREISFKDEDKKNWFEAKIEKERITLKILKGKVYDSTVYRLPIVFRVNANQNEKVVQWMKRAIPLQKKSVAMDEIDTAAVDTTKETKEEHKQSSAPESSASSTREKTRSVSLTSDSADDATSTTTTDIQDAIILSHQEVKEGATEQEEIKIRTVEELLQKSQRIRRAAQERSSGLDYSISANTTIVPDKKKFHFTVDLKERYVGEIRPGAEDVFTLTDLGSDVAYLEGEPQSFALTSDEGDRIGTVTIEKHLVRVRYEHHRKTYRPIHAEFRVPVTAHNFTTEEHKLYMEGGNTRLRVIALGLPADQVQARPLQNLSNTDLVDRIVVNPSECMDGNHVNVRVEMSEKRNVSMNYGDTLTIKLPQEAQAFLKAMTPSKKEGEPDPFELRDQYGDSIGTIEYHPEYVTVHFTKQKYQYNASAYFEITCLARNTNPDPNGSTAQLTTNFGIPKLGYQTISITHPEEQKPERPPFYYKSGAMSPEFPNRVQWWLNGNIARDYLYDNVYIRDQVQAGHEIDLNSIHIYFFGGVLNGFDMSMDEFNMTQFGHIDASRNGMQIYLEGHWMSGVNFTIAYQTIITDPTRPSFENKSQIYYRSAGSGSEYWGDHDFTVQNIFFEGGASSERLHNITLRKVDADKPKKKLENASFILKNVKTKQVFKGTTNKKGRILFTKLPFGDYTLEEVSAPEGYKQSKTIYELSLTEKGIVFKKDYQDIIDKELDAFTVTNKKKDYTGPKLPNTGGDGYKTWFILVACTLILGTMILYIYNKKGTHTQ